MSRSLRWSEFLIEMWSRSLKMYTTSQWRLRALKWNVYVERVVEQIIDVQKLQVKKIVQGYENRAASRGHAVPALCSWKESQDRIQQRTSEQVANTRVQPPVNPVEVKQPKIFKMTTQRKHFSWTGKVPGEQASRRCCEGQDHQDENAVKENPNIQEKSRPREQAKRNSPNSKFLRSSSWAYQAPPRMQRQVPPVQIVHKNQGRRTSAVHRQSVDISVDVQRQVPKELKPVEIPQARHDDKFVDVPDAT